MVRVDALADSAVRLDLALPPPAERARRRGGSARRRRRGGGGPTPTVAFDLSFGAMMNAAEAGALANQLAQCYGANRKAARPFRLALLGCLRRRAPRRSVVRLGRSRPGIGITGWCARVAAPAAAFAADARIVYLTSDADEVLDELRADTVYVVGELVDTSPRRAPRCAARATRGSRRRASADGVVKVRKCDGDLTCVAVFQMLLGWRRDARLGAGGARGAGDALRANAQVCHVALIQTVGRLAVPRQLAREVLSSSRRSPCSFIAPW